MLLQAAGSRLWKTTTTRRPEPEPESSEFSASLPFLFDSKNRSEEKYFLVWLAHKSKWLLIIHVIHLINSYSSYHQNFGDIALGTWGSGSFFFFAGFFFDWVSTHSGIGLRQESHLGQLINPVNKSFLNCASVIQYKCLTGDVMCLPGEVIALSPTVGTENEFVFLLTSFLPFCRAAAGSRGNFTQVSLQRLRRLRQL